MGLMIMSIITLALLLAIYAIYGLDEMCSTERTNACILLLFLILGAWGTYYAFFI